MKTDEQNELIPLELGEMLQLAREKKGISLKEAAEAIKTRAETLAAIESGNTQDIASVYLKGNIRNYARFLEIPRTVIEQHMHQALGHDPGVQSIFKEALPRNSSDRWIKASSYVLASVVVIALVWQFTTEAVRFSQGDPLLRPSQEHGVSNADPAPGENLEGEKSPAASGSSPSSAKSHLRASIASMNAGAEQTALKRPVAAEGAWAAISNRNSPPARMPDTAVGPLTLEILTSADSWVEIKDGSGTTIEMDLLRAGSRRNYNGAGPFHLLLGRASSVEVFRNGDKVDLAPYIRGNVARLTLEAETPQAGDAQD